jgi:hypothetical protein
MRLPYCLRTGSLLSTGTPAKRRTFLNPGDINTSSGKNSFVFCILQDTVTAGILTHVFTVSHFFSQPQQRLSPALRKEACKKTKAAK